MSARQMNLPKIMLDLQKFPAHRKFAVIPCQGCSWILLCKLTTATLVGNTKFFFFKVWKHVWICVIIGKAAKWRIETRMEGRVEGKEWAWSTDLRLNLLSVPVEETTLNYKLSTSVQAPPRRSSHKPRCPQFHTAPSQMRTAFSRAQELQNVQGAPSCRRPTGMCWELPGQSSPRKRRAPRCREHHDTRLLIFHPAQWIVAFRD